MASLQFFLSANRPEDDVSASGGAVDLKMRLILRDECDEIAGGAGDTIDIVSTAAGDVANIALAGWQPDGTWAAEVVAMNGTNHVQSVNTYQHLRKVEMAADAIGVVTIARFNVGAPVTLFTIPIGERGRAALFLGLNANAAGGAAVTAYEKFFLTGEGGAQTGCKMWCSLDEDTELKWDCEEDVGGNTVTGGAEQVANRLIEPNVGGGYTWADHATAGTAHTLGDAEDGNMIVGEDQGIWVQVILAAGRGKEQQICYTIEWSAS